MIVLGKDERNCEVLTDRGKPFKIHTIGERECILLGSNRWSSSPERFLRRAYRDHRLMERFKFIGGLDMRLKEHSALLDYRKLPVEVCNECFRCDSIETGSAEISR